MRINHRVQLICVLALAHTCPALAASRVGKGEAARLLETLRSSAPAPSRAVSVRKFEIDMGPATLMIDQGVLVPASPVGDQTLEVAFVGDAWFRFSTHNPVEVQQLELFTGEIALATPVSHAVLVTGNEETLASILRGEPATGEQVREAVKLFEGWVEGPERQGFAADLSMVKSLMGDPLYRGYFAVWCRSPDHGDFYYVVRPSESEPVTLGQFVPLDMSGLDVWQQRLIKSFMRRFKFFGRFADFSVEHPGNWDTWVSTVLQAAPQPPTTAFTGPEPEHYTVDLYVNPKIDLDAKGSASVRLRAGPSGARSVPFTVYPGLRVTAAAGAGDQPLDFIQREGALHVFLADAAAPGATFELRLEYEGDLVEALAEDDSYALLNTQHWYPQTGEVNRATYDVTLRRPKKYAVLGSGRVIASGERDGVAWEQRKLDLPALGFTFELGRFDVVREQAGHVEVTFGFPAGAPDEQKKARTAIVDTVKRCLPFFEEKFGPYPLDHLTVVTVDRGFSQGMLSMLTLADAAVQDRSDEKVPQVRQWAEERRALTIAHEVSHQWWGNWVGWASYRDQWLSEALAEYSALLCGVETAESKPAFMVRNARDWRSSLTGRTADGRSVASLGPVTLGVRLFSSKAASRAYQAIVYDKGAVVFRMLSRIVGEEPFAKMLGELSRAVANRTIDTATFLKAMEKMSGHDLQPFADQFVYGTGIPEVYYRYAIEPKGDGKSWTIQGDARQVAGGRETLKIVRDEAAGWRVDRQMSTDVDVPASTLVVPFQVVITPPEHVQKGKPGEIQSARGFGGRLVLKGAQTPFLFTIPQKPELFELDQLGEVLALFHDEDWTPKLSRRRQALDLGAAGDLDAMERMLREALASPAYSERATAWMSSRRKKDLDNDEEARFQDSLIHALLARLLLDRGDLDGAEKEIAAAEGLLKEPSKETGAGDRLVLRARLDLARGDAEAAYQRLGGVRRRWYLSTEGYAVLAIAAHQSGHDRAADQALERAESRGVDVRALRAARSAAKR